MINICTLSAAAAKAAATATQSLDKGEFEFREDGLYFSSKAPDEAQMELLRNAMMYAFMQYYAFHKHDGYYKKIIASEGNALKLAKQAHEDGLYFIEAYLKLAYSLS